MRSALASITASPFWAMEQAAFRGSLPSLIKRLSSHKFTGAEEKVSGWDDLEPSFITPDGNTIKFLDGQVDAGKIDGSVAVINVKGTLVKECMAWEEVWFGVCSMDRITNLIQQLTAQSGVAAIVLNVYSHGGMVDGVETLGNAVRAAADAKPCIAFVDSCAASGGYWTVSNCTRIVLSGKSAGAGSVGVMMSMFDDVEFWESLGFEYYEEYATASTRKNEGIRKLRKGDNTAVVAELDGLMEVFQGVVQGARKGRVKADSEVFTGAMFKGQEAIGIGLADSIGSLTDAINLARTLAPKTNNNNPPAPTAMSKNVFAKTITAVLAPFNANEEKAAPTAEDIAKANGELAAAGVQLVTAEQAKEIETLSSLKEKAALADQHATKVEELTKDLAKHVQQRTAVEQELKAAMEANGIKAEEGKSDLAVVLETLSTWGKATTPQHSGGQRKEDEKNKAELSPSQQVAQEAGIHIGE